MAKTVPVKTLKKMLKKAGLKTTGRKAALTRRAKKAKLMKGGHSTLICTSGRGGADTCPSPAGNCPEGYALDEARGQNACTQPSFEKKGWFSG